MPARIARLQGADQADVEPRLYMQIAQVVRRKIESGDLKPGDPVSITDLKEQHGVSRQTASKGLILLCEEGRLKRWPGHGYAVQRAGS
jgi:DNA-binding GntR family transcriptional regulator